MTNTINERIHRIYNIVLAVMIAVAGICLMAGCLTIYRSGGDEPYTREAVAEVFSKISVPVYAALALTLGGFIYELISPLKEKKKSPHVSDFTAFAKRISQRKDMAGLSEQMMQEINKVRRSRFVWNTAGSAVIVLCFAAFLAYALNANNFDSADITGSVVRAMGVLVPCLLVAFAMALSIMIHNKKCSQNEIGILRQLENKPAKDKEAEPEKARSLAVFAVRAILLVLAAALLIYGAVSGGYADVLTKAVNICTECIGLG